MTAQNHIETRLAELLETIKEAEQRQVGVPNQPDIRLLRSHPISELLHQQRRRPLPPDQLPSQHPRWALRFLSRVGKRIYESVVQSGRDFPYIRVSGGQ